MAGKPETGPAVIIDVDGTLVDSNYHHAIAWFRALRRFGATVPVWQIHRHMGMGGDQLVAAVAGEDFEREHGDDARAAEKELYAELIDEIVPLPAARDLVAAIGERGNRVVLASSAKESEVEHYLDLLDARDLTDAWTHSGDVEQTKPAPDLVHSALEKIGGGPAVMIGDSTWDCRAAAKAGVPSVGVLTGGFSPEELREAGAADVFESLEDLIAGLDRLPLGG